MDLTYVPTHLCHVTRNYTGWPIFIADDEEFQAWLVKYCRMILTEQGPMSTADVYEQLRSARTKMTPEERQHFEKLGIIFNYIYACIDRALRVIASQVWKLD